MAEKKSATYRAGLAVRREVLGRDYVDASLAAADSFTGALQDYLTEHAWGAVWTRAGLPRKTRSLLNLAMLTALNRPAELKLHLVGALRNGVTREEIREVFLQAAVYCGAPAALDSFKLARRLFAELDAEAAAEAPAAQPKVEKPAKSRKAKKAAKAEKAEKISKGAKARKVAPA